MNWTARHGERRKPDPDDAEDLTIAYMAGFEKGKDQVEALREQVQVLTDRLQLNDMENAALKARLWNYDHGTAGMCADAAIGAAEQWQLKVTQVENAKRSLHIKVKKLEEDNAELDHALVGAVADLDAAQQGHFAQIQLEGQLAAMTKERDQMQVSFDAQCVSADKLFDLLAIAQARIVELKEMLDTWGTHTSDEDCPVCVALALPADDSSALERRLQEERERIAKYVEGAWDTQCAAAIRSMTKLTKENQNEL